MQRVQPEQREPLAQRVLQESPEQRVQPEPQEPLAQRVLQELLDQLVQRVLRVQLVTQGQLVLYPLVIPVLLVLLEPPDLLVILVIPGRRDHRVHRELVHRDHRVQLV